MESGNTSNGTVTDLDGYYSISLPEDGTIVFTCLGFEEVQEPVSKRNTINVSMAEEKLSIDAAEVVSIGYGTVSRRDLTGSVSKVDMGEVMKSNVTNFDQALTGRVAGVVVSTSDGALGEEANITIRGNNSLTQSSAPLYIIDGFPSESSMATSLNSADIESIDILKDASATAIYGARGANGVTPTDAQQSSSASGWLIYSIWGYRPVKPLSQGSILDDYLDELVDSDINSADDYRFNPAKTVRNEYRKTIVDYFSGNGSLSWNFNREDLLKDSRWLKNGKLRLSWGQTGNNRTTTPYDYYAQIETLPGDPDSYDYVFDGQTVSGYYPSNMANDDLKWETTEQWNVGLDLSFFENDRIRITADWYMKNTYDLLLQATMPASSGYTSAMMNIGSMRNTGVELSLETLNINKKNFQWTTSFNIAFNRNKVTALTSGQYSLFTSVSWDQRFNSQYPYVTQVGKPSGLMYGYIYEGTYKESDFINGSTLKDGIPYSSSTGKDNVEPGDPKYTDINGDGIIDDNDRTVIGCGQPLHTGGFGNTFYFYGFDVNIFFSWSYGNDILNANRLIFENGNISNLNQLSSYTGRYDSETNPDSDIPAIGANDMFVYSSRVVEDGSFLKLRNIAIGYTLPHNVLRRMRFDTMRVYVSADNIWTWTNYSGPDPEVSTRNSVLTPGFDWSAYPRSFGLTAGVSFTF